ncbi:hypothetical protein ABIA35_005271 [Catenulispora sp. MAP12-49]|uniref:hypothetical protein n=1 Tax=Catenulispora sp. MAP12-49 TaxID=3156302 RepID=UPI003518EC2F
MSVGGGAAEGGLPGSGDSAGSESVAAEGGLPGSESVAAEGGSEPDSGQSGSPGSAGSADLEPAAAGVPESRPAASEVEAFGASALADTGDSPLARRLSELGLHDGPRVVWRRPLAPRLRIRVREDDALLVSMPDDATPVAVIDPATGADSPPPAECSWPAPVGRLHSVRLDPRSGYVIAGGWNEDGRYTVTAVDPGSGAVVWQNVPFAHGVQSGSGWRSWLADDHPDAEALVTYQFIRGDEPTWQYSDPFTGSQVWTVEWWMHDPTPPVDDPRDVMIGLWSGASRLGPQGITGLRAEDGAHLWYIECDSGRWQRYKKPQHPLYAGKSDHCVVLAELVSGTVDLPTCPCGRSPDDRLETYCEECGGNFTYAALVHVFDRATGRLLFHREWPDPDAPATAVADVVDIRSDVLLTREGSFVRGHSLPEGRQLWSVVPPIATTFDASGRHPGSRWAWLRPSGPDAGSVAPSGLFLHAPTGRTLNVPGAFHHTADDHVITRDGGDLMCWALPAR